jgi:hypothetical protein
MTNKRERQGADRSCCRKQCVCVCDGESDVGGRCDDHLNSITMPNGLLPVLEEELQWLHTIIMMLNSSVLILVQK